MTVGAPPSQAVAACAASARPHQPAQPAASPSLPCGSALWHGNSSQIPRYHHGCRVLWHGNMRDFGLVDCATTIDEDGSEHDRVLSNPVPGGGRAPQWVADAQVGC